MADFLDYTGLQDFWTKVKQWVLAQISAHTATVVQTVTSGTKIGSVDGTDLYAPASGGSLPSGGAADTFLAKNSAADQDAGWRVLAASDIPDLSSSYTPIGSCPFPVGSVYISVTDSSPSTTWPGTTWTQVAQGRFLVGQDTSYAAGTTGDPTHTHTTASHKLTAAESGVPAHNHPDDITVKTPTLTHTITQPTIASSGKVTGGITGGSHQHPFRGNYAKAGWSGTSPGTYVTTNAVSVFGTTYAGHESQRTKTADSSGSVDIVVASTHTHDLPNHSHTLGTNVGVANHAAASCTVSGGVSNNTAAAAANAHSHGDTGAATAVPPWFGVYMWERTA